MCSFFVKMTNLKTVRFEVGLKILMVKVMYFYRELVEIFSHITKKPPKYMCQQVTFHFRIYPPPFSSVHFNSNFYLVIFKKKIVKSLVHFYLCITNVIFSDMTLNMKNVVESLRV